MIFTRYPPTIFDGRPALAGGVRSTEPQSNSRNPPGRLAFGVAAAVAVASRPAFWVSQYPPASRSSSEDGVAVGVSGLHGANGEALLRDRVRHARAPDPVGVGVRAGVVRVHLLPQHRTLQRPAGFPLLRRGQAGRQRRVRQQQGSGLGVGPARLAEVLAGVEVGDVVAAESDAGVEPGLRVYRRDVRPGAGVAGRRREAGGGERREFFAVPLLDHAEAAELALVAVEVAVVVGVAGDEAFAADVVVRGDTLDHVHRHRQPGDPGPAVALVL
jgi:hypothetical protein